MDKLDTQVLKEAWFNFEEIKDIQEWILDLEEWRIYNENDVFSRLYKKISSNLVTNV